MNICDCDSGTGLLCTELLSSNRFHLVTPRAYTQLNPFGGRLWHINRVNIHLEKKLGRRKVGDKTSGRRLRRVPYLHRLLYYTEPLR